MMKLIKLLLVGVIFMTHSISIFAESTECTVCTYINPVGDLNLEDNETICLKDNYIWTGLLQGMNEGTLCVETGSAWSVNVPDYSLRNISITNHGTINFNNNNVFFTDGIIVANYGLIEVGIGSATISGVTTSFSNLEGGTLHAEGGFEVYDGEVNNQGVLDVGDIVLDGASFYNHSIIMATNFSILGGSFANGNTIKTLAVINIAGTFDIGQNRAVKTGRRLQSLAN